MSHRARSRSLSPARQSRKARSRSRSRSRSPSADEKEMKKFMDLLEEEDKRVKVICKDCLFEDCKGGEDCPTWCKTCKRLSLTCFGARRYSADDEEDEVMNTPPAHLQPCPISCKQQVKIVDRVNKCRHAVFCCFCDTNWTLDKQPKDVDAYYFVHHLMRKCASQEWLEYRAKFYPQCFCAECHIYSTDMYRHIETKKRKQEAKNKGEEFDWRKNLLISPEGDMEYILFDYCDKTKHRPKPCQLCKRAVNADDACGDPDEEEFFCEACWAKQ